MHCKFCNKFCKNLNSLRQHEIRCKLNSNRIPLSGACIKGRMIGRIPTKGNLGKVGWNKGLKGVCGGRASTPEKEKLRCKRISLSMKVNPNSGGKRHGSGRGKQGWYKGIWCDSSWELAFVIYNLEHNIQFERNKEKFYYEYNNKKHYWLPDFIINNIYYEIKGYEDEKAKIKHSSFTKPLKIIRNKEIKLYLEYVENKYGKDFIKLYEKGSM